MLYILAFVIERTTALSVFRHLITDALNPAS